MPPLHILIVIYLFVSLSVILSIPHFSKELSRVYWFLFPFILAPQQHCKVGLAEEMWLNCIEESNFGNCG